MVLYKLRFLLIPIRFIKGYALIIRSGDIIRKLTPYKPFEVERQTQTTKDGITVKSRERITRIKPRIEVTVRRNGVVIHRYRRKRDLLVWRGQSVLAYLLSQGAVGTATASWKAIASENNTAPDMADDSGNPEANEFNPLIGTTVAVTYTFYPDVKISGGYQTYADIIISGTVISDGNKTLRKIGIIDTVAVPNRHIIVEDSVVPFNVILNDEIEITYTAQLG